MREKFKHFKPIQKMMVLVLLVLLTILTTQTSAIGQTLCDGKVPTILGTQGSDEINGTAGPDVIHGLGGPDFIRGLGGDDVICGGDGPDMIASGDGNDIVFGENGHDGLWGGHGDDILRGGDGNDSISGGSSGNDRLYGDNGNDSLFGRSGVDELYGGEGTENNDSCYDEPGTLIMGCEQFNGEYIPPAPVPKETSIQGGIQTAEEWPDPRVTDNGDGTVTDNLTGLIWLKNADCFGELKWGETWHAINNLADGQCGLTDGSNAGDWQMPNVKEMFSMTVYFTSGIYGISLEWPGWIYTFEGIPQEPMWTNTMIGSSGEWWNDGEPGSEDQYITCRTEWLIVHYRNGTISTVTDRSSNHEACKDDPPANTYAVWPVRGGN